MFAVADFPKEGAPTPGGGGGERMPGVSNPFYCSLLKIVGRKDAVVSKEVRILSV